MAYYDFLLLTKLNIRLRVICLCKWTLPMPSQLRVCIRKASIGVKNITTQIHLRPINNLFRRAYAGRVMNVKFRMDSIWKNYILDYKNIVMHYTTTRKRTVASRVTFCISNIKNIFVSSFWRVYRYRKKFKSLVIQNKLINILVCGILCFLR